MKRLPKDGYYFCKLECRNRGSVGTAVKIHKGKVTDYLRTPQDVTKLSSFHKMPLDSYVYWFKHDAANELRALRKFKTARMRQLNS